MAEYADADRQSDAPSASEAPFLVTHGAELEAVYANAPIGLCVLDRDLRFIRINERLAEINGPSVAEHLGRTVREVLPNLADTAEPALRRVLETGEPAIDVEVHGVTPARPGVERTWRESWIPLRDAAGSVIGVNVVAREITEEKAIERRLRESEAQFRALVEQSPFAMLVFDRDGGVVHANHASEALIGAPLTSWPSHLRIPRDAQLIRLGVAAAFRRVLAGERVSLPPFRFEPTESDIPGRARVVAAHLFPIHDERADVQRIVAIVEDVSDREEEEQDRWFLFQLGSELQALTASDAICKLVAQRLAEFLSASRCAWSSVDPDTDSMEVRTEWRRSGLAHSGRHALQRWRSIEGARTTNRLPETTIFVDTALDPRSSAHHDELFAPLDVRAFVRVPMISQGRWLGSLALASEVPRAWSEREIALVRRVAERAFPAFEAALQGERAEAERKRLERLQRITAELSRAMTAHEVATIMMREGMAILGADGAVLALRSDDGFAVEIRGALGVTDEVIATWQRVPIDATLPLAEAVRTAEAIEVPSREVFDERYPALVALVAQRAIARSFILPLVSAGHVLGACSFDFRAPGIMRNEERDLVRSLASQCAQALDRVLLFEREREARRAAELANQAKSTFLAAMSHELRTPLNAIQGHVQLIELGVHGPINDAQRTALERVQRNQRHLLALVNDLLNLSRIESGRVDYHLAVIDIAELVAEVADMVTPQLNAKAIRFETTVERDLRVWADREKATQILINLLDNAAKFTPEGGRVSVSTHTRAEAPGFVFVRVTDTGRGIGEDKLKRIFEPFVQLDKVSTGQNEGVGLGLAISRELARGMRGDIRARSRTGQGSTFTLALRRDDSEERTASSLLEDEQ